jgi:hypothetical protein
MPVISSTWAAAKTTTSTPESAPIVAGPTSIVARATPIAAGTTPIVAGGIVLSLILNLSHDVSPMIVVQGK